MAKAVSHHDQARVPLFNSALETGVRAVVILDAAYPRAFDLTHLTWLDHLVVHTADIGGPPSLHPDIPQRTGELLVRRRLVEDGLTLMRRQHLIDMQVTNTGILYQARDEAAAFIESLRTVYSRALRERAKWLIDRFDRHNGEDLERVINERIGRWSVEFQADEGKTKGPST